MSSPVVTTTPDSSCAYARELMERKQVNAIPIVDINRKKIKPLGIITTNDIKGLIDETIGVNIIMSKPLKCIDKDTTMQEAAKKMIEHHTHHLLVIEEEKMIGILSSLDFVKMAARE